MVLFIHNKSDIEIDPIHHEFELLLLCVNTRVVYAYIEKYPRSTIVILDPFCYLRSLDLENQMSDFRICTSAGHHNPNTVIPLN